MSIDAAIFPAGGQDKPDNASVPTISFVARGLLRFGVGALAGAALMVIVVTLANRHLSPWSLFFAPATLQPVFHLFLLGGGLAATAVGWLVRWRRAPGPAMRLGVLALAWSGVWAILACSWLAADRSTRQIFFGILSNERFTSGQPVSYWLEQLSAGRAEDRSFAVYCLSKIGPVDPRVPVALRQAVLDADDGVANAAVRALEKCAILDAETVQTLGSVLRRKEVRYSALHALQIAAPQDLQPILPDLCRLLVTGDYAEAKRLLMTYDPTLKLPRDDFNSCYYSSRVRMEADAPLVFSAVKQMGPAAVAECRAVLWELLASPDPMERRFAAYAIAGFGAEGKEFAAALMKVVDYPQDPVDSDALPAALALVRIGEIERAATAFCTILRRRNFSTTTDYPDVDPWQELRAMPAEVRAGLPEDVRAKMSGQ